MTIDWTIWQLADSTFPAGGFAHSAGLEAAWQSGELTEASELVELTRANLTQTSSGLMPFAIAAHANPASENVQVLDARCDAFLCNHVANRASRAQGRGFLAAAEAAFPAPLCRDLRRDVNEGALAGHWAPVFGAVGAMLGLPAERAMRLFLHLHLRDMISSAVRLNVVGPLQGQHIQHRLSSVAERCVEQARHRGLEDISQTAPVIDLLQATHDRLYSRLFRS